MSDWTRDEIVSVLKVGHEAEIKEADEWRPLAQHVLDLLKLHDRKYEKLVAVAHNASQNVGIWADKLDRALKELEGKDPRVCPKCQSQPPPYTLPDLWPVRVIPVTCTGCGKTWVWEGQRWEGNYDAE